MRLLCAYVDTEENKKKEKRVTDLVRAVFFLFLNHAYFMFMIGGKRHGDREENAGFYILRFLTQDRPENEILV